MLGLPSFFVVFVNPISILGKINIDPFILAIPPALPMATDSMVPAMRVESSVSIGGADGCLSVRSLGRWYPATPDR
jgi:hypothetical protein